MKVGDLVSLSAAGKKLNMNYDLVSAGGYGMVIKPHNLDGSAGKVVGIRWFKSDGAILYPERYGERNVYRWELKKFKKIMNKEE
jgi:hypothetical protein